MISKNVMDKVFLVSEDTDRSANDVWCYCRDVKRNVLDEEEFINIAGSQDFAEYLVHIGFADQENGKIRISGLDPYIEELRLNL